MKANEQTRNIVAIFTVGLAIALWTRVGPSVLDTLPAGVRGLISGGAGATRTESADMSFPIAKLDPSDIRYVAVGDSYTCGTGTTPDRAWPAVLTNSLRARGIPVGLAANLGVDGWTTKDAIDRELPAYDRAKPMFATLMIGVNDTYRTTTAAEFRSELTLLMDRIQKRLPVKRHLIVLTIPDFSVTSRGSMYAGQNDARNKIRVFNGILREESDRRHVPVVDVFPMTQKMGDDPTLVAADQLHPSAREYALWANKVLPVASAMLRAGR